MNITGTTVGAPTAIFPLFSSTSGSCSLGSTAEPYRLYTVVTDINATITVNITNTIDGGGGTDDTGLFWYQGTFSPTAGCTNFRQISNDPSGANLTFAATANTTYTLAVVGLFGAADAFAMTLTIPMSNITVNPILPVELLGFSGYTEGTSNRLTWATANEINVSHFNVERSVDGLGFEKIGVVKAQGSNTKYSFIDNTPFSNLNYYRLKTNDLDGKVASSKIINLTNSKTGKGLNIYPNPAHNRLTIDYPIDAQKELEQYTVVNTLGQTLLQGKLASNSLDISSLPTGAFILKIGEAQAKFFKQ